MTGPGPVTERSHLSRLLLWALALGDGMAVAVCLFVTLATLIRQRPIPGLKVLLIAAIPLLIAGQLWMILVVRAGRDGWGRGSKRRPPILVDPRRFFFGQLRSDVATGLLLLAFVGWLAAITTFPSLARGGPDGGDASCPYRLTQDGVHSCVSKVEYDRAGAGEQRSAAGVLLVFFSLHTGAALSGVLRGPRHVRAL